MMAQTTHPASFGPVFVVTTVPGPVVVVPGVCLCSRDSSCGREREREEAVVVVVVVVVVGTVR
jgi:hypothetical protein